MPLFGKKKEPIDWITSTYQAVTANPTIMRFLMDCLDYEKQMHPKDIWDNTNEETILTLAIEYLYFNAYCEDRIENRLSSNPQALREWNQLKKENKASRKTGADVDKFLRRYIPNKDAFSQKTMQDFYNLGAKDADDIEFDFDIDMDTGTVKIIKK